MSHDTWHGLHIGISVLATAAALLLGMLFWNTAASNRDPFTTTFLRVLSIMTGGKVIEIVTAMYRTSQIDAEAIPVRAGAAGLLGRGAELTLYLIMIWFLLRPETRKALNGGSS